MVKPVVWGRAALTGAALVLCFNACDSVLGIEEPQDKPTDGGEAGEQPAVAGKSTGGSNSVTPQGGAGGDPTPVEMGGAGAGGEGGEPPMTECSSGDVQCGGDNAKTPQICDETGHWVLNTEEADGECGNFCAAGKCTECQDDKMRCSDCYGGEGGAGGEGSVDASCNPNQRQKCVKGEWTDFEDPCANYCDDGACKTPTSCNAAGSRAICNDDGNESCCRSMFVPGGAFKRDYDGEYATDDRFDAIISPFFLDRYEVTVGRMKQFVAAYANVKLQDGDGKSKHVVGDTGWKQSYQLPDDAEALTAVLKCVGATWADDEENIRLPINCVPFEVAYAFCIWDGGRLPTETEWNFAAAGGNQQRIYPWGSDEPTADHAYFGAASDALPKAVGSTPKGAGRYSHADLSGNVSEWTLDYYYADYPLEICEDCLAAMVSPTRSIRGGPFTSPADNLLVAYRGGESVPNGSSGFRCARELK